MLCCVRRQGFCFARIFQNKKLEKTASYEWREVMGVMGLIWGMGACLLLGALLLPVQVQGQALWAAQLQGSLTLRVGPLHVTLPRKRGGHDGAGKRNSARRKVRPMVLLRALKRRAGLRRFLVRMVHLDALRLRALIATGDAAHTALLSGAVWGTLAVLPAGWRSRMEIQVQPDFFSSCTRAQGVWIIHARLGMLLTGTLWLALAAWQEGRGLKRR